jgi:hypothetical protein
LSELLDAYPSLAILATASGDEYVERNAALTCMVSRCVMEPGEFPRHARREESVDERDSGSELEWDQDRASYRLSYVL